MNAKLRWSVLIGAVAVWAGCAGQHHQHTDRDISSVEGELEEYQLGLVEKRAAFDFDCDRQRLSVETVTFNIPESVTTDAELKAYGVFIYGVEGCGRRATYVFQGAYPVLDYMEEIGDDEPVYRDGDKV